jgi:ankyrin repeat protein
MQVHRTPLHLAAAGGHDQLVQLLLKGPTGAGARQLTAADRRALIDAKDKVRRP